MKKLTTLWFNFLKFFKDLKVKQEFAKLEMKDKKSLIIDQLMFGMSTNESIELLKKVNIEFKTRMDIRKQESIEIVEVINAYYN